MTRLVVVGGGILGTMHAVAAVERGWSVVQLERESAPRGASVRNFGLVWVSGRACGPDLALALRARHLWAGVAQSCPEVGFRACGSVTVARGPQEVAILEEVAARPDAAERGWSLLTAAAARRRVPALAGACDAALLCTTDAVVEPRRALPALRAWLGASGRYRWLPGRQAVAHRAHGVQDHTGAWHDGDLVVLCPGAAHTGIAGEVLQAAPLRRIRIQMLETQPFDGAVPAALADGDSLRYYPAYAGLARDRLPPQAELPSAWRAQLLLVQRPDGGLTIGDTHEYQEPFPFDVVEAPMAHCRAVAETLLGRPVPPVLGRWAGTYSQVTDESLYLRRPVGSGVVVVTGPGGRGMTLAPAIAEETVR